MGTVCEICGKGLQFGHKVSHANNKSSKVWKPNLQKVKILIGGAKGKRKRVNVCTSCISGGKIVK